MIRVIHYKKAEGAKLKPKFYSPYADIGDVAILSMLEWSAKHKKNKRNDWM